MNWTLEVVILPVTDLDRAKAFYADQLGFNVDHDTAPSDAIRVIQLTPPGSSCSIVFGNGIGEAPGAPSQLQLVVNDVRAAHKQLKERVVDVTDVQFMGPNGPRQATDNDDLNNAGFIFFADPDGNRWSVQQITNRP